MCILCENGALELLTGSLDRLGPGRVAEAIRSAREAASAGILDHAEAVLRGDAPPEIDAKLFEEIVVNRAVEAGVLDEGAAYDWRVRIGQGDERDPRVQAFVSSCVEILDEYRALVAERRPVLERFVEAPAGAIRFWALGVDGEPWFEYDGDGYAVLNRTEALAIVERELGTMLHSVPPGELLRYTRLPDIARDAIARMQAESPDVANATLAELVDLRALAEDRVAAGGYAPFFRGEPPRRIEDLRFGEWIIIRMPTEQ